MKKIGTGKMEYDSGRYNYDLGIYEFYPARRILCVGYDKFFVPFPWTYFVVGRQKEVCGFFLMIGFLPEKFQPEKSKKPEFNMLPISGSTYFVCLGSGFNNYEYYWDLDFDVVAKTMINAYFASDFVKNEVFIPIHQKERLISNFRQWSQFKNFKEMNIDWEHSDKLLINDESTRWDDFEWSES